MFIVDVLELIEIVQGCFCIDSSGGLWCKILIFMVNEVYMDFIVLIVDDFIMVWELFFFSFKKVGFWVEQVRDGQEVWD